MERFFIDFSRPYNRNGTRDLILTVDLTKEIDCKIEFVCSCQTKQEAAALEVLISKKMLPYVLSAKQLKEMREIYANEIPAQPALAGGRAKPSAKPKSRRNTPPR